MSNVDTKGKGMIIGEKLISLGLQVGIFQFGLERCLRTLSQYKWGFFSLDWNGVFVLFPNTSGDFSVWIGTVSSYSFPTFCTFLVGKGRKRYTTLRALRTIFPTFSMHLVGKGRKRYTTLRALRTLSQHSLCI